MARITYDYTDRDYAALRNRLQALTKQQFPSWTDYNEANFGNHFLKMMAFVGDMVGFYQDNQAGESRISTATQRRNMIGLLKLLGYRMKGAIAAQHEETFSVPVAFADPVTIAAGTIVKTRESTPTEFQLLEALVLAAGQLSVTGTVEHSKTHDEPDIELDGSPNQRVRLEQTPFLDGSLNPIKGGYVQVEGLDYEEVDNFLNSTASDRHFIVTVDDNDRAFLLFGDGVNGIAPQGTLEVRYKTGGGIVGNAEAGAIKEIVGTFTTTGGRPVTFTVTNALGPTILGEDRETVEQARVNGPASIKANTRTVSRTDFEDNSRLVDGVGRALALTKNEDPTVISLENTTYVYIVPTGGGVASDELKASVTTMLTETRPVMTTHVVNVFTAVYKTFDIVAWVYLSSGAVASTVRTAIQQVLQTWFEPTISDAAADLFGLPNENVNFGFYAKNANDEPEPLIRWSDIHDLLKVAGVRKLGTPADGRAMTINGVADDVALELIEFPILGTVTIYNGDTGAIIELPPEG